MPAPITNFDHAFVSVHSFEAHETLVGQSKGLALGKPLLCIILIFIRVTKFLRASLKINPTNEIIEQRLFQT